jgi:hypothetical protein
VSTAAVGMRRGPYAGIGETAAARRWLRDGKSS